MIATPLKSMSLQILSRITASSGPRALGALPAAEMLFLQV